MGEGLLKARLLSCGAVLVPPGAVPQFSLSASSAGPGAGSLSIFLELGGSRVRLEALRSSCALEMAEGRKEVEAPAGRGGRGGGGSEELAGREPPALEREGGRLRLVLGGEVLAESVRVAHPGLHAPRQAFINLRDSCIFNCAFCALPRLPPRPRPSAERWLELVSGAVERGRVDAVAVTSGVWGSAHESALEMADFVRRVRAALPDTPVGVEPYTTSVGDIEALWSAGATELKLNIQCATGELMKRVCPGLDWRGVWRALEAGVEVFGRNRVCSNLILGLGESDEEALDAARELAGMGVLVNLRPLRTNALNLEPLTGALGRRPRPVSASSLLRLAMAQKRIFKKHSLDPGRFRTMCHRCTACELAPFRDV